MNSSLISQIVLVIVSVVLILMYIRPGFENISSLQDELQQLQGAIETADEFTRALQQLQAKAGAISSTDLSSLMVYLPDEADQLTAMWVLETIASEAGVSVTSIVDATAGDDENVPDTVNGEENISTETTIDGLKLTVGVSGSYDDFKNFLRLLEVNEFPFLTQQLTIGNAVDEESDTEQGGSVTGAYTLNLLIPEYQSESTTEQAGANDTVMEEDMF